MWIGSSPSDYSFKLFDLYVGKMLWTTLAFESYDTLNVFPCIPQVVAILLEEGKEDEDRGQGRNQTHINVSEGYTQLDLLPLLQGELLGTSNGYILYLAKLVMANY